MRGDETRFYLEMRSPTEMRATRPVAVGLKLVAQSDPDVIRDVTLSIGRPYDWPSQRWDDGHWAAYLARRDLQHWTANCGNEITGLASLRFDDAEVELDAFGLLPQHVGKGLGGDFLTLVTQLAWREAPTAQRFWLHTSSKDHPNALRNYKRLGFSLFRTDTLRDQELGSEGAYSAAYQYRANVKGAGDM